MAEWVINITSIWHLHCHLYIDGSPKGTGLRNLKVYWTFGLNNSIQKGERFLKGEEQLERGLTPSYINRHFSRHLHWSNLKTLSKHGGCSGYSTISWLITNIWMPQISEGQCLKEKSICLYQMSQKYWIEELWKWHYLKKREVNIERRGGSNRLGNHGQTH